MADTEPLTARQLRAMPYDTQLRWRRKDGREGVGPLRVIWGYDGELIAYIGTSDQMRDVISLIPGFGDQIWADG